MKKIAISTSIILLHITVIFAKKIAKATLFKPNYSAGINATKESLIAKTSTDIYDVEAKNLALFSNENRNDIVHNCFFYNANLDKKITNVFPILYEAHLYLAIVAILDNRNEKDSTQTSDCPNNFVKVIFGGNNDSTLRHSSQINGCRVHWQAMAAQQDI